MSGRVSTMNRNRRLTMAVQAGSCPWKVHGNPAESPVSDPWIPDEVWSDPGGRASGRRLTKWDSKQQKKRQADDIRKSLFNFESYAEKARANLEEERNRSRMVEEKLLREKEVEELEVDNGVGGGNVSVVGVGDET